MFWSFFQRHEEAFNYVSHIDPWQYARCYNEKTAGRATSQLIESLWASIVKERAEPLSSLYISIVKKFSIWTEKHRYNNLFVIFLYSIFLIGSFLRIMFQQQVHAGKPFGLKLESKLHQWQALAPKFDVRNTNFTTLKASVSRHYFSPTRQGNLFLIYSEISFSYIS